MKNRYATLRRSVAIWKRIERKRLGANYESAAVVSDIKDSFPRCPDATVSRRAAPVESGQPMSWELIPVPASSRELSQRRRTLGAQCCGSRSTRWIGYSVGWWYVAVVAVNCTNRTRKDTRRNWNAQPSARKHWDVARDIRWGFRKRRYSAPSWPSQVGAPTVFFHVTSTFLSIDVLSRKIGVHMWRYAYVGEWENRRNYLKFSFTRDSFQTVSIKVIIIRMLLSHFFCARARMYVVYRKLRKFRDWIFIGSNYQIPFAVHLQYSRIIVS